MNILIFNWRDIKNPSAGGAEILTHEMAKRWVSWGNKVTQFSSIFPGSLEGELIDGVRILRHGYPDARRLFSSVHFLAFWYYQMKFKGKIDVVIDEIHGLPFFTPWYVREKKAGLICEVAGDLWEKTFGLLYGFLGRMAEQFYLRIVYRDIPYLTISPSTKKDLVKNGVKEQDITILPMGITLPNDLKISKKDKELTLIFVGRLTVPKGVEDAIYAFSKIYKKDILARLWIIGRGEEYYVEYLKKLCKKLKIYGRVTFFGFIEEREKFILMSKAHFLIHPSLREGFGLTISEAGFVGTPVIAYNSPGLIDVVVNNRNGILLKKNSAKAIADNVLMLFKNRDKYRILCKGAKEESQLYDWDKTAKSALSILKNL